MRHCGAVARRLRLGSHMENERNADPEQTQRREPEPIDESTYGASSSESGGLYSKDGPTIANEEGDTMSEREERGGSSPDLPADG